MTRRRARTCALFVLLATAILQASPARGEAVVGVQANAFRFCSAKDQVCNPVGEFSLAVSVGTTVSWRYNDVFCDAIAACPGHNVVFEGEPGGPMPVRGNTLDPVYPTRPELRERMFDKPGTYHYWCVPHKAYGMLGVVIVKA
jgi:plastocyanin